MDPVLLAASAAIGIIVALYFFAQKFSSKQEVVDQQPSAETASQTPKVSKPKASKGPVRSEAEKARIREDRERQRREVEEAYQVTFAPKTPTETQLASG